MAEILLFCMLGAIVIGLISGYPVAFVLGGVSLLFAFIGIGLDVFAISDLQALPLRIYGIMRNELLIAIPLFIYMGVMLERAKIAEELLHTLGAILGNMRSGLGLSVMLVGTLLAASTGIVGATVVTMGLISLPTMLKAGYNANISCGTICAAGTLGQVIPPSIVLILLGDQISAANQLAQMQSGGSTTAEAVSIADLFLGALAPGLGLVLLYMLWLWIYSKWRPDAMPATKAHHGDVTLKRILSVLCPPLLLIIMVLGSILSGIATATESAAVGAFGAMILAFTHKQLTIKNVKYVMRATTRMTSMIFTILIGATLFTLVFRSYGGDEIIIKWLSDLPGGLFQAMLLVMLVMFILGFFLDFIEIIFVVVPIVAPILLAMGADPIWLAIMIAINLQTSFLTPPFGFSLFYLRGAAPESIATKHIYHGVIPFIVIQLFMLIVLASVPSIATWLPHTVYGKAEASIEAVPDYSTFSLDAEEDAFDDDDDW